LESPIRVLLEEKSKKSERLMRRELFAIAICVLMVTTIGCEVLEVKGKPSADFGNRTVTVEQGSSFTQELTLEGRGTDYRNLKVHFRMPDGVTSPDTPKTETLEDGEEWTVIVHFQVGQEVSPATYTVFARGEWEEFNEEVDGWEGNEGELTKFTLIVQEKSSDSSDDEGGDGTLISFSNPIVLGLSGVGVLVVAVGGFLYYRSRQRTEIPKPQTPSPGTETTSTEEPGTKKFCRYCGTEIDPETAFCSNCGRGTKESDVASKPP
jgi:hypothetical protein